MADSRTSRRTTGTKPRKARADRPQAGDVPTLEWVAAAVGLVLAGTAISLTAWDALFGVKGPPAIEVRLKRVTPTSHGYVAEIEAFNHGGASAAQVEIEGVITGASAERASVTIDYVPAGSRATGGLIFDQEPSAVTLRLRAKGFSDAS